MTRASALLSVVLLGAVTSVQAQYVPPDPGGLEGIIVEKYYVTDANDAADTDGGPNGTVPVGSTTYRVFVDMLDGYKLLTVAGYVDHDLTFNTTTTFFYNEDRGEAWADDLNDVHVGSNTVAIDSWLTMGAATDDHWGVLKSEDTDGSIVGGANNDGGSEGVAGGLLVNATPEMGIPLTEADGLHFTPEGPPAVVSIGTAPTIFNELGGSTFTAQEFGWTILGGVESPLPGNKILIGQFTTDGTFSFCLNIWLKIPTELVCGSLDCHQNLEFYGNLLESDTAGTNISGDARFTHPTLCYNSSEATVDCLGNPGGPAQIGTACDDGNADTTNDRYAPSCECLGDDCEGVLGGPALPGTPCDDNDPDTTDDTWATGCNCVGSTGIEGYDASNITLTIHPNPTSDLVWLGLSDLSGQSITYALKDAQGRSILVMDLGRMSGRWSGNVDLSDLSAGIYFLEIVVDGRVKTERITKH